MSFHLDGPLGIDPRVDIVFQAVFGAPAQEAARLDFLSAVFGLKLCEARVVNPFDIAKFEDDKLIVVDVLAKDETGRTYQIEMQRRTGRDLPQRMVYNWARIYGNQLLRGQAYLDLRPVLSVWICEDLLFRDAPQAQLRFELRESSDHRLLHDDLRIEVLQLRRWASFRERLLDTPAGRWFWFFNEAADAVRVPEQVQTEGLEQAMDVLRQFRADDHLRSLYDRREEAQRVLKGMDLELQDALRQGEAERKAKEAALVQAESARLQAESAVSLAEAERREKEAALQEKEAERREKEAAQHALATLMEELAALRARSGTS